MPFNPESYYRPSSPQMRDIAAEQTLARWRCEGVGPAYIKIGGRILYLGADVIKWLKAHRVEHEAA